jgi:hypothetical protein
MSSEISISGVTLLFTQENTFLSDGLVAIEVIKRFQLLAFNFSAQTQNKTL